MRWDGGRWTNFAGPAGADVDRLETPGDEVWASNSRTTWRLTKNGWVDLGSRVHHVRGPPNGPFVASTATGAALFDPARAAFTLVPGASQVGVSEVCDLTSAADLWAVSVAGIRHFDGTTWTQVSPQGAYDVIALAPDDVWFVDRRGLRHWDGQSVKRALDVPGASLIRVGRTADLIVSAGMSPSERSIAFRVSGQWRFVAQDAPVPRLVAVGAVEELERLHSGEALVVENDEATFSYANGSLRPTDSPLLWDSPPGVSLAKGSRLCGPSASHYWRVGREGAVWEWTAGAWRRHQAVPGVDATKAMYLACAGDRVWAWIDGTSKVGVWNGTSWSPDSIPETVMSLSGAPSGEAWALSTTKLYRWDSAGWAAAASLPVTTYYGRLEALDGSSVLLWTGSVVYRWDGTAWTTLSTSPSVYALSAASANNVYLIGQGGLIRHYDGASWTTVPWPSGFDDGYPSPAAAALDDGDLLFFSRTPSDPAYLIDAALAHWDATSRRWDFPPAWKRTRPRLAGTSTQDVWALGDLELQRRVGGVWQDVSLQQVTAAPMVALAASPSAGWAAGTTGAIVQATGTTARLLPSGTTKRFTAAFARTDDDVWLAGDAGVVRHWDGASLQSVGFTTEDLKAVWASSASDVWIAGTSSLFHFDGSAWRSSSSLASGTFTSLTGAGGSVFATASPDVLLAATPTYASTVLPSIANVLGVSARAPNDLYVVGSGGLFHGDGVTFRREAETVTGGPCTSVWVADAKNAWATCAGAMHYRQQLP